MTAFLYAYGVMQTSIDEIPPGYAAIAAAILTVGNVDIQDPMLAQVVDLMTVPATQHEESANGNGS